MTLLEGIDRHLLTIEASLVSLRSELQRNLEKYAEGTLPEGDFKQFEKISNDIQGKVKQIKDILANYQKEYNKKYGQTTLFN